ncbi:MAG: DNA translocase FtsK 4TM domain-containing protein [Bacteroidales bacterium]
MAKKRGVKNVKEREIPKAKELFMLLIGLFFLCLSLYTALSLVSYLFTWAEDQSIISISDPLTTIVPIENQGGKMGFYWANFLIKKLFGLGSFIFPLFFGAIALYALKIKKFNWVKLFYITIYGMIVLSLLLSYLLGFTSFQKWFGGDAGGSFANIVKGWLIAMVGFAGTGMIILLLFFVWLLLINRRVVAAIKSGFVSLFSFKLFKKRRRRREKLAKEPQEVQDKSLEAQDKAILESNESSGEAESVGGSEELESTIAEPTLEVIENLSQELPVGSLETNFDPRLDLPKYKPPTTDLLNDYKNKIYRVPIEELERNKQKIVKSLGHYKIGIEKIEAVPGPTVTLYQIVPTAGVRISQIKRLEDDIALSLAARGVRIIAPIPGTHMVGIEVANSKPSVVPMKLLLESSPFRSASFDLPVVIGRTISNEPMMFDLAKMPHLLVAGATGQGKSVGLNAIITSLLFTKHPSEMKMVLIDPKKVELSLYSKIENHFLAKLPDEEDAIITDTEKVIHTLKSLTKEMDNRYDLLKLASVRFIKEYNEKFLSRRLNPKKGHKYMHYIVVVIDEFADLLMTAGREIEEPIVRLAQLARAVGIHLVIATQRPTTNIITGLIKANFPARIAFRVISNIDSRTILETSGANQLVGRGDMLISVGGEITRVQCALVETSEVEKITNSIAEQQGYPTPYFLPEYSGEEESDAAIGAVDLTKRDALFDEAAQLVVQFQLASTSFIQRRMNLGYNRAGRIMDQLEAAGIVGPQEGSKGRVLLIQDGLSLEKLLRSLDN